MFCASRVLVMGFKPASWIFSVGLRASSGGAGTLILHHGRLESRQYDPEHASEARRYCLAYSNALFASALFARFAKSRFELVLLSVFLRGLFAFGCFAEKLRVLAMIKSRAQINPHFSFRIAHVCRHGRRVC